MDITVDTQELKSKLELVGKVSTKHVTLPVLQCILMEASEGTLILKSTNLEIAVEAKIKTNIKESGIVAIPASVLIQTVNLNNQKETSLKVSEGTLVVDSGLSKTQIKTIPYDEFPNIPKLEGSSQVINRQLFSLGIKTAAFAASQSSIKPELGSVYIYQKKEHTLTFVATDSFRLVEKTTPQKGVILEESIMIPYKNAIEIARICDLTESEASIQISDNQCTISFTDGVSVTSRLTNGSFPDYVQIIPKEYVNHTTLLRSDLVQAFKKSNIFLNKFFQVSLAFTKGEVIVSSNSGDVGNTVEEIKAEVNGEELTLNFNQRYVAESLSHFVDDSITLNMAGIGRPMVIEGVNDKTIRYLVMPMNK